MQEDSCKIHLPDGRCVDVCTTNGADAFIEADRSRLPFSRINIGEANKIREKSRKKKNGKLSAAEKYTLGMVYFTIYSLAQHSTPEIFAANVPQEEIEAWMNHVVTEIREMTTDQKWIQTGILEQHDTFLLNSCISMFQHAAPVSLAFGMGFFKVLSEFVEARTPPLLPCPDIADTVALLIGNLVVRTIVDVDDTARSAEKTFKKLESSGMLVQYLRCVSVPQDQDNVQFSLCTSKTFEGLIRCNAFVKKKFKEGEPCGDVVNAILSGNDGSTKKRPKIMAYLQTIASYTDMMQNHRDHLDKKKQEGNICRHCNKSELTNKFQDSMKKCAQCRTVFYCSRECQRADWKSHKKQCNPVTKADEKRTSAIQQILCNFAQRNYVEILAKIVEICGKTGLNKMELLLELDFMPDDSGTAPALREPAEFKIAESHGYFEGSRPNEPDWFLKNQDRECYKKNIKNVIPSLRDLFGRLTEHQLLCLVRYSGGFSCYRLQLHPSGVQLFSNSAVDAFKSAIHHNDFGPLKQMLDPIYVHQIESTLVRMGLVTPSEEWMSDYMRRFLSLLGGDFS